jgi:AcrR family transcriptional regulator
MSNGRGERGEESKRDISKSGRTRERLIEAAIDEIAEKGFRDAKVSGIVARVGYTQPTFYLHFKSKDAIREHLADRVQTELRVVISNAKIPAEAEHYRIGDKISNAIEALLQYFIDNPKLASIGYFDSDFNAALREEIVALISQNVAFEQGAGFCRPELDPTFVSQCFNGTLERLIRVYLLSGRYDAPTLARLAGDLYGHGMVPGHPGLREKKEAPELP